MNETDVRSRILAVATRLFGQQGYGATSVREVAEAVREPSTRHEVASEEHPSDVLVPQAPPARVAEEGMVREAANE